MRSKPRLPIEACFVPAALLIVLFAAPVLARPPIRQSFFNAYPSAVGTRLDNLPSHSLHCGVCHYDFNGGGTRNPYGVRIGNLLASYPNNDAGRQQLIHSIENEDSDGDGFTQLIEVTNLALYSNTPTFPGLTGSNVGSTLNVPNLGEITPYLVPQAGSDTQPPLVTVLSPNGGQSWAGGSSHGVTWNATDNVGVTAVDVYYRSGATADWTPVALNVANSGTLTWFVHNTPTTAARVRVVARDATGNSGNDPSDADFTITAASGGVVPTTLRDFDQPGTQPFGGGSFEEHTACSTCHGGYDVTAEPAHNALGTMMMQAARDPLFFACLAIAEQDAPSSGDLCLRCHTPFGWMGGRSNPTSGAALMGSDFDGVACDFCHRAVNPVYQAGTSPPEDQAVLAALLPAHTPAGYSNGQYVADPVSRKRGPRAAPVCPHPFLQSAFHRTSEFCGTCHDVSNPVFNRVSGPDYAPGPLDQAASVMGSDVLLPLERTYSEWKHSAYPAGVFAPEFAGNRPDGIVSTCQDCHLHDVTGKAANDAAAAVYTDLALHDMTGGNSWMPGVVASLYPAETDAAALADAGARAVAMLQKAAGLEVEVTAEGDSFRAAVTITNRTGHKLPTGYPEGRRMWLHVTARDENGAVVYESGHYDPSTGMLAGDPAPMVYEIHLGLSPGLASALAMSAGPSFHFALNDTVYKDNRIPPLGFTNAAFGGFGGTPVEEGHAAPRYPDGRNWDTPSFALPAAARSMNAVLYYQTTSKDYVEFLRNANTTNASGQVMHDAWVANGRAAPVAMASDAASFTPVAVTPAVGPGAITLAVLRNPFRGTLAMRLELPAPAPVRMTVADVQGRRVAVLDRGELPAGTHRLEWDGRDAAGRAAGSGVYWVEVDVGASRLMRRVVRLR